MVVAFVSDIHSNLEAFEVVLADVAARKIREIYCLGDVIGYGPNPRECIELAANLKLSLRGNHEEAVLNYAEDFNDKAKSAIEWTRNQLNSRDFDREANYRIWNYLDEMRESATLGSSLLVHGSPRQPTREYVMPQDVKTPAKIRGVFAAFPNKLCFCGHTHIPGVFTDDLQYQASKVLGNEFAPDGRRAIVNVGSVGQPRDGDVRACYATFDGSSVRWHRLDYDVAKTMAKIRSVSALPEFLAERLGRGR
ncbi:MAG: metallophosphoesterase family protein [Planctomycetes bacterium]|nr:metallophosphoesterase family protein [Planctomycetota bacterium]MBI3846465.1 metallophosphoesterase family protein [Planctomycetota bacterium]